MKRIIQLLGVLSLVISFSTPTFAMQKVFYVLHDRQAAQQTLPILQNHAKNISLIISQAYHFDKNGKVTGFIDPDLLQFTQVHKIKLMALVTNSLFDPEVAHQFLTHPKAQDNTLNTLLQFCKQQHLYGVQFDLEMVPVKDKNLLTAFYQKAANVLHQNNFAVSFAVGPRVNNASILSPYQSKQYKVWIGAYDFAALGKVADFVTLMAYDQHLGVVAPGPTASLPWVEEVIHYALRNIPANKISLGIPSFSNHWYTGPTIGQPNKIRLQCDAVSHAFAQTLLQKRQVHLHWDPTAKVNFVCYEHHWLNEYLFVEDVQSFKAKLALVDKYHLQGFSMFRVGIEDPRIWDVLSI